MRALLVSLLALPYSDYSSVGHKCQWRTKEENPAAHQQADIDEV
jgi:hypothetical protein